MQISASGCGFRWGRVSEVFSWEGLLVGLWASRRVLRCWACVAAGRPGLATAAPSDDKCLYYGLPFRTLSMVPMVPMDTGGQCLVNPRTKSSNMRVHMRLSMESRPSGKGSAGRISQTRTRALYTATSTGRKCHQLPVHSGRTPPYPNIYEENPRSSREAILKISNHSIRLPIGGATEKQGTERCR